MNLGWERLFFLRHKLKAENLLDFTKDNKIVIFIQQEIPNLDS